MAKLTEIVSYGASRRSDQRANARAAELLRVSERSVKTAQHVAASFCMKIVYSRRRIPGPKPGGESGGLSCY